MADNTDETHVDDPTNTKPENPSAEIIPTGDTDNISQNKKLKIWKYIIILIFIINLKNGKNIFLNFLMIFLAVTMGFLAESYREHIVAKEIEKTKY